MSLVNNLGLIVTVTLGGGAVVAGVWRFVRKVIRALDILEAQLQNNGGSSMKDKLEHVARTLENLDRRVDRLERRRWPRR